MKNQARPVHDAADFHDKMLQHMQEQGEVLRRISSSLDRIDAFKSVPPPAAASGPSTREPLKHQEGSLLRRTLDDDLGWSAVMKVALEKLHSLLASWKESLDTILLFIALFSAIVTAFLVPTIGNLTPQPGQDTDVLISSLIDVVVQIASLNGLTVPSVTTPEPFQVNPKDEVAASFWFTSLIVSILCAGLAAFARFQMLDIAAVPNGPRFINKVARLKEREFLAKWLVSPILDALHWCLVVAIGLFIAGLLYQLWGLHSDIPGRSLLATGVVGTLLSVIVIVFMLFVTIHAIVIPESPFDTSLSRAIRIGLCTERISRLLSKPIVRKVWEWIPYRHLILGLIDRLKARGVQLELEVAANQFCELVSECHAPTTLDRAAPVLVECFEHIGCEARELLEPAIMQVLDPETRDETKLTVLRNIPRLGASLLSTPSSQPSRLLANVLLRIQEENVDRKHADIRSSAFCALIHFVQQSGQASPTCKKQSIIPEHIPPASLDAHILLGLQSWNPACGNEIDVSEDSCSKGVSEAFLGSLLEWDHLSEESQKALLACLPLDSFLCSYVVAIYWANEELGQWDHRGRYRRILTDKVRTQLDDVIGRYPDNDLLANLASFIGRLDKEIPKKRKRPEQSRRACAAVMGILRRIRLNKKLPADSKMLSLGPLADLFPPVETHIPRPSGSLIGPSLLLPSDVATSHHDISGHPVPKPISKLADLVALRHREALVFYIERFGCTDWRKDHRVLQFLADCKKLSDFHGPQRVPLSKTSRKNKIYGHDLNIKLTRDNLQEKLTKEQEKEVSKLFERMGCALESLFNEARNSDGTAIVLPPASWETETVEAKSAAVPEPLPDYVPQYPTEMSMSRNDSSGDSVGKDLDETEDPREPELATSNILLWPFRRAGRRTHSDPEKGD